MAQKDFGLEDLMSLSPEDNKGPNEVPRKNKDSNESFDDDELTSLGQDEKDGVERLFNEIFDIKQTIELAKIDYYQIKKDGVYYKDTKLELQPDFKGRPDKHLKADKESGDPLGGLVLTPFKLLSLVKFANKVAQKQGNRAYKRAVAFAKDLPQISKYLGGDSWISELSTNKEGGFQSNVFNVMLIFKFDPYFKELRYNAWTNKIIWRNRPIQDSDVADFIIYLGRAYGLYALKASAVNEALTYVEHFRSFDPLLEYLEGCYHDYGATGTYEMDHIFQDFLGCDDTPYTTEVSRLMLCGAIGRAFVPGCKFDTMFLIQGARQGQGKSTLIKKLGAGFGREDISIRDFETKAIAEKMRGGAWLCEIPEMDGLSGLNENTLKAMLSKSEDYFRPAYARNMVEIPRRTVFVGTVNDTDDLFTDVKNRRFIVIQCNEAQQKKFSFEESDLSEEDVRKIWGQAMALYRSGAYDKHGLVLTEASAQVASDICESLVKHDLALSQLTDFLRMPRQANWSTMPSADKQKCFRTYINNANEAPGEFVHEISLPEIMQEMLDKPITSGIGDDRIVIQIKKELTRLGYHKGGMKSIPGYGKSVQMFVRNGEKERKRPVA